MKKFYIVQHGGAPKLVGEFDSHDVAKRELAELNKLLVIHNKRSWLRKKPFIIYTHDDYVRMWKGIKLYRFKIEKITGGVIV